MLVAHLDTEKRVLILEYPKRAHLPKQVMPVRSTDHAITVWEIQARKYIFETLRRFVQQRQQACQLYDGARYAQCMQAVEKLMFMLMWGYESPLAALCAKVVRDARYITVLEPGQLSRYRKHYEEVIAPIVEWCGEYVGNGVQAHS